MAVYWRTWRLCRGRPGGLRRRDVIHQTEDFPSSPASEAGQQIRVQEKCCGAQSGRRRACRPYCIGVGWRKGVEVGDCARARVCGVGGWGGVGGGGGGGDVCVCVSTETVGLN